MSDLKIPEAISEDFELALLAENPVPRLVTVMLGGLDAMMPHGVNGTIENWAVRLAYVKAWAEWCHFVKPTPTIPDSSTSNEEIIEKLRRHLAGTDTSDSPAA